MTRRKWLDGLRGHLADVARVYLDAVASSTPPNVDVVAWLFGMRSALADLTRRLDAVPDAARPKAMPFDAETEVEERGRTFASTPERATPKAAPPDTDRPPRLAPDDPDPEDELYAIECAWRSMLDAEPDVALDCCPLVATMFTALACSYEGAEDDRPSVGVLMAIRETVCGWSGSHSESTVFASVAYADLALMMRRIDVVIALVRADAARRKAR